MEVRYCNTSCYNQLIQLLEDDCDPSNIYNPCILDVTEDKQSESRSIPNEDTQLKNINTEYFVVSDRESKPILEFQIENFILGHNFNLTSGYKIDLDLNLEENT